MAKRVVYRIDTHPKPFYRTREAKKMLWTIIILLLVLWALGFGFAGQAVGSLIHILLVVALVLFVVQLLTGRRAV
jgi:uncharacterized membrane protein YtjA (UPF0391 family)